MITLFVYKCRRCCQNQYVAPEPGETEADVLLRQVSVHRCAGTTADGHIRMGISDLVGFNEETL